MTYPSSMKIAREKVRELQALIGVSIDGVIGRQTLWELYRWDLVDKEIKVDRRSPPYGRRGRGERRHGRPGRRMAD